MLRESFQSPPSELLLSVRSVNLAIDSIYLFICIQGLSRFLQESSFFSCVFLKGEFLLSSLLCRGLSVSAHCL